MGIFVTVLATIQHELVLMAAVGIAVIGIDDLIVDLIWVGRELWRRYAVYARHPRATVSDLPPSTAPGTMAVFIPTWDESEVIAAMLRNTLRTWHNQNVKLYVGCYPNDDATFAAIRSVNDPSIRIVICETPGPTTKADCLNAIWRTLAHDEVVHRFKAKAIILHDAEDIVHPKELIVFDRLIDRFALIQLPVIPLLNPKSRWIGGHYMDEFCEAHGKDMVVREAIGARLPLAGVGCAIRRDTLLNIARANAGNPFDATSLTEDYEFGLKLDGAASRSVFVRLMDPETRKTVAVRAHFPATLNAAVRQKTRWIFGIALAGWDRVGWSGGFAEHWMRLRDRRTLFAAIILISAYASLLLTALLALCDIPMIGLGRSLSILLGINALLLLWRMIIRIAFVSAEYGWKEGLFSGPRMIISNIIAIMAARRAVFQYLLFLRYGKTTWDKTSHAFPDVTDA